MVHCDTNVFYIFVVSILHRDCVANSKYDGSRSTTLAQSTLYDTSRRDTDCRISSLRRVPPSVLIILRRNLVASSSIKASHLWILLPPIVLWKYLRLSRNLGSGGLKATKVWSKPTLQKRYKFAVESCINEILTGRKTFRNRDDWL